MSERMKKTMIGVFGAMAVLWVGLIMIVACAHAEVAASFSHGPTIPMYAVRWGAEGGPQSTFLAEGAGYSFNANFAPSDDGRWRYFTVGMAWFVSTTPGEGLNIKLGLPFGTMNNLVAVGPFIDLASFGDVDSGLLVGNFSKENVGVLISFNLNLGGGAKPTDVQKMTAMKTGVPVSAGPPPGYVKLW